MKEIWLSGLDGNALEMETEIDKEMDFVITHAAIWLSGLDGNALEMETEIDKEMDFVITHAALEWRWMESKIPSTKSENHFHRHCVRNLLVRDPKLGNCIKTKVLCRRRTLTKTFDETSSTTWTVAVLDRKVGSLTMDHFGSGLYSASHGGQRHDRCRRLRGRI
ncbi:hypothetical protein T03_11294 [Trichinella britovi]|uniref:Uncharacterized protein n=1 Tax=Trichinella britovi TaxID=45882 RepID=A0A0V1C633_TRIBR|nr:hypothetical protein T03_11294 [Trichinella britovi]